MHGEDTVATEAYCMKCREKREMVDEEEVVMKNGRPAAQGTCPECGTKLFRIKSTKDSTVTNDKATAKSKEKKAKKSKH